MPSPAQTSITVTIGPAIAITYVLGVTSAPPEYDGFGTLTLYDNHDRGHARERYVAIQQQHESWHEGRYRSGLFSYSPSDALPENTLASTLYRAMTDTLIPAGV